MTSLDPTPPPPADDPTAERRNPTKFLLGLLAVAVLLGGWVYVLFIYDPGLLIDELADKRFPTAAEEICATAVGRLEQLPQARETTSPFARADAVEQSNVILHQMIDDLEPFAPTEPAQVRDGVAEWIGDWRTYIADRERYVDNLRSDPDARFLESPKGAATKGITRAIDGFAQVNSMNSCVTPQDVA